MAPDKDTASADCAVAATLQIIGERWSIVILRDMFYGFTRFEDFAKRTGAPRDILTTRLRKLEAAGIIERRLYSAHPPRHDYHLTQAGLALSDVLLAMMSWGRQYIEWGDAEPVAWTHECGEPINGRLHCAACGTVAAGHMTPPAGRTAPVEGAHF